MNFLALTAAAILLMAGCAEKPHYLHEEAPQGHIAPPSGMHMQSPQIVDEERSRGNLKITKPEEETVDVSDFVNLYHEKKQPKIIIYVNKDLNDHVSVVMGEQRISFEDKNNSGHIAMQNVATVLPDLEQSDFVAAFMQKVDKAFIRAYTEKRVNVLDRNFVLRMQEVSFDKTHERKVFSVLEMSALKDQADLFMSVQPEFYTDKIKLYVKAIDLKDGRVIISDSYELLAEEFKTIVLSDSGYQVVDKIPDLDESIKNSAYRSMSDLAKSW